MIIKSYNADNLKPNNNFFLFYGKNEGFKNQEIKNLSKNFSNISNYEQKEIIENSREFLESIFILRKKKLLQLHIKKDPNTGM